MKNLKALYERRDELQKQMDTLVNTADGEKRAMNETEIASFDAAEKEIREIDETVKREERARAIEKKAPPAEITKEQAEERAFADYIKRNCGGVVEQRVDEQNFTMGNNGALIPTTIVNRIINTVKDMCPIFAKATIFAVKGTLKVPVYGLAETTHDITVGYQDEFTDITADAGAFTSVDLTGFLAGALSLIGKSVITNSEIDVTSFVIAEMGRKIALFLEKELLVGTSTKATGALSTSNTMNAGSTSAISADNLIDLQAKVKQVYQGGACWTMAPATFTAIRKLKYADGRYMIQDSFTGETPFTLLGKPVYLSDNMPAIGSANKAILYGDYSGLGVNMRQNIEMQVLNEKYATMHAIGVVSWFEFDSKVIDKQKLAVLIMSA
jgi:HK97 family phage major capsid protein